MSISLHEVLTNLPAIRPDERRGEDRIAGRILVRVGTKRAANKGLVHNLSLGGLGIYTRVVYPPGTAVALLLEPVPTGARALEAPGPPA